MGNNFDELIRIVQMYRDGLLDQFEAMDALLKAGMSYANAIEALKY
jgi:hypothetical protein